MLTENKSIFVRKISSGHQLDTYGLETVAYIKSVVIDGQIQQSVHAADGTQLALIAERELAFATVRQHDLEPTSVH